MGKSKKDQMRVNALKWLKEDPSDNSKEKIRKALVQFLYEEELDLRKKGKPSVTLKQLLPILRNYDERWALIKYEDINTSKYHGVKRMNDHMHKLLENKSRLRMWVRNLESDSDEGEEGDDSESKKSLKGDDVMARDVGEKVQLHSSSKLDVADKKK